MSTTNVISPQKEGIKAAIAAVLKPLEYCGKTFQEALTDKLLAAIAPVFNEPTEHPTRVEGEDFSVDVFILDETGVHGIAFWNFDDQVWRFHTDTLVDYNEPNAETKWKWYYPPYGLNEVFGNDQK